MRTATTNKASVPRSSAVLHEIKSELLEMGLEIALAFSSEHTEHKAQDLLEELRPLLSDSFVKDLSTVAFQVR